MRSRKEENILASIEESIQSTALDFDNFLAKNITMDWKIRKEQICQYFGLLPSKAQNDGSKDATNQKSKNGPVAVVPGWNKNSIGRAVIGPVSGGGEFTDVEISQNVSNGSTSGSMSQTLFGSTGNIPSSHARAKIYMELVREFNKARLNKETFPISTKFYQVSLQSTGSDVRSQQLQDIWRIFHEITGETINSPIPERKFAHSYLVADQNSREAIDLRKTIVRGSKKFLEKQFMDQLESAISKNPVQAQLGGIPSVQSKVRAFLNLRFSENGKWAHPALEIINNVPVWAMVYFMIRAGYIDEAVRYTSSHREEFLKLGSAFPTYLEAFNESPNKVLPQNLLENIRREFNEQIRYFDGSSDPYKHALYKIIGRCELSKKSFPGVIDTTEDWLWIHLSLVYEEVDELSAIYDKYTLQNLQLVVTNFGPKYFNPENKTPTLYCQVLIMVGLFEKAMHYTYSFSQIDAVHFSIALTYYGLLRPITNVIKFQHELLYTNKNDVSELNFARLMGHYTHDFRRSDCIDSVEYLVLICLNGDLPAPQGAEHLKMCHEALKELVLETREFSKLLGDIRPDGSRKPGAIEERMPLICLDNLGEYLRAITEQAALKAEEDGRVADAVLLYQLSEEYDTVVTIVNKSLGEMLAVQPLGQSVSQGVDNSSMPLIFAANGNPAQLARHIMDVYTANVSIYNRVKQRNRDTCATLLRLVKARDLYAAGEYEQCLQVINDTNILVLEPHVDITVVRQRAQEFVMLHQAVARNVPSLLVMVLECCSRIVAAIRQSHFSNDGRTVQIEKLRGITKNCMVYSGMIQYKMPKEVFVKLSTLETQI